jgi:competence protein ComEC
VTWALKWLAGTLGIGIAATLVSTVTGVEFFQGVTPFSLGANLVLIPLASLVIVAGFLSLASGLFGATLISVVFNHAAVLVLWCIDRLVRLDNGFHGAWWPAQWRATSLGALALATLLGLCLVGYTAGWARKCGGFWLPAGALALVLIFGVKFG